MSEAPVQRDEPSIASSVHAPDDTVCAVRVSQVELLAAQLSDTVLSSLLAALGLALLLRDLNTAAPVLSWYGLVLGAAALRLTMVRRCRKTGITPDTAPHWARTFVVSNFFAGLVWGVGAFLADFSDVRQVLVTSMVLCAVMAAGGVLYAASLRAVLAFMLPIALALLITVTGHTELRSLTWLLVVYSGMNVAAAVRIARSVSESLRIRHENQRLADRLHAEQAHILGLNALLEGRVQQRTLDLSAANTALQEELADKDRMRAALARSESLYRSLYHDIPSLFITLDARGFIESINDYGASYLGHEPAKLLGHSVSALGSSQDAHEIIMRIDDCLREPGQVHSWKTAFLLPAGARVWVRVIGRALADDHGALHVHLVCEDITEAHELERKLSFQASHDPLTALYNRGEFEARLLRVLRNRRGTAQGHALCYMDLDQFKLVNDTCGHVAGDELLRRLSAELARQVRAQDTLARLGGDEFGILLQNTPMADAVNLVERLRQTIEDFSFTWNQRQFKISASFGLTMIDDDSTTPGDVLRDADTACYLAKESGRNRIQIHVADDRTVRERRSQMNWVNRIDLAIANGNMLLARQPIVDTTTRRPAHWEMLIRLRDEDGSIIPPGFFLPAAERYGIMPRLDRWVLGEALRYLHQASDPDECIAINLSGASLGDDRFMDFVTAMVEAHRPLAARLCFEITETSAIANLGRVTDFIHALKALGCQFSLDDFGTGMASFDYLRSLPVDFLKIDGSFIKDIASNPISHAMVRAVNDVAHIMNMKTIAEFVENEQIATVLAALGIDYLQGYAFGRPELTNMDRALRPRQVGT